MTKLQGIFTPNLVPLDEHGQIDEAEMRRYTDWLIDKGVHGLYPNGSTGEFVRFTAPERRRIIEIMVDHVRGRVPVLAGAAEANVAETIDACDYYHQLGVDAVAIVSPYYYKLSPGSVHAYFAEIAKHTQARITLYNIPLFASPIDVPTVQRLAEEHPNIIGIKDSSGDLPHMMRMIDAVRPRRPDFSFLTGWEAALLPMLLMGCDGGTNATSGIVPELTRKLYDWTREGRIDDARSLQYQLLRLFDAMIYTADFPEGFRAAARLRGFKTGPGRQPLSAGQIMDLQRVSEILQCLLAEHGFVDEPISGCPPRRGSSPESTVEKITQSVVQELKRRGLA